MKIFFILIFICALSYAEEAEERKTYTAKAGETIFAIAEKTNPTKFTRAAILMMELNKDASYNLALAEGQKVILPSQKDLERGYIPREREKKLNVKIPNYTPNRKKKNWHFFTGFDIFSSIARTDEKVLVGTKTVDVESDISYGAYLEYGYTWGEISTSYVRLDYRQYKFSSQNNYSFTNTSETTISPAIGTRFFLWSEKFEVDLRGSLAQEIIFRRSNGITFFMVPARLPRGEIYFDYELMNTGVLEMHLGPSVNLYGTGGSNFIKPSGSIGIGLFFKLYANKWNMMLETYMQKKNYSTEFADISHTERGLRISYLF